MRQRVHDFVIPTRHIAEGFNLGVHCYADDGQLYLYDRVQALPGGDIQSRVVYNRDRELDELKPTQAQFGKDTVHLAWKSS